MISLSPFLGSSRSGRQGLNSVVQNYKYVANKSSCETALHVANYEFFHVFLPSTITVIFADLVCFLLPA